MIQYWILFLLILIVLYVGNGQKSRWPLLISLALIFLFFAFREGFTPDYEAYLDIFESKKGDDVWSEGRHSSELLFQLMVIYLPYRLALVIQTALFCYALFVTFKATPYKYWWFCVMLLFFIRHFLLGNMGGFRSCFVTVFFLLAVKSREVFGRIKGGIIGVILIIISSLVHRSGLVMIPIYLLTGPNPLTMSKQRLWLWGTIAFVIISFFFAGWLNELFNNTFQDIEELGGYFRSDIEDGAKIGMFTIFRMAILLFLLFFTLSKTSNKEMGIMEMSCVKLTVVYLMFTIMPDIGLKDRFCYYLCLPAIIGSISIIKAENSAMKFIYIGAWILYAFWEYYLFVGKATYIYFYSFYHNILFDLL